MSQPSTTAARQLTEADVLHVAHLAQLDPTPQQITQYRAQLGSILAYVDRLGTLDLTNVEPMSTPLEATLDLAAPQAADAPTPPLPHAALLAMAPAISHEHYLRVPKVIGDGGAA